jgi:8-oxo-dGTP pyrophosphatase MutT (NUDIX family)
MTSADPRIARFQNVLAQHPPQITDLDAGMREAAVALLLRPRDTLDVLLIKRAEQERDPWSGHVALPGGRRDASDADLLETAQRETQEEVGIPLQRVGNWLGRLDDVAPRSLRLPPLTIAAFVFEVPPDTAATPNPREVDAALWVPLPALQQPDAVSELVLELEGGSRRFPSLRYGEHVIWGLTHRILTQFLEHAAEAGI